MRRRVRAGSGEVATAVLTVPPALVTALSGIGQAPVSTALAGAAGGTSTVSLPGRQCVRLDPAQMDNARAIARTARDAGLLQHSTAVALAAGMQESGPSRPQPDDLRLGRRRRAAALLPRAVLGRPTRARQPGAGR